MSGNIIDDKDKVVINAMIDYGRPSIVALGSMLIETGSENIARIKKNCPKTWALYNNIAHAEEN